MTDKKFNEALKLISEMVESIRSSCGTLKYPALTGEMNNLLWCLDGISEVKERFVSDCKNKSDIQYYEDQLNKRIIKIETIYSCFVN